MRSVRGIHFVTGLCRPAGAVGSWSGAGLFKRVAVAVLPARAEKKQPTALDALVALILERTADRGVGWEASG